MSITSIKTKTKDLIKQVPPEIGKELSKCFSDLKNLKMANERDLCDQESKDKIQKLERDLAATKKKADDEKTELLKEKKQLAREVKDLQSRIYFHPLWMEELMECFTSINHDVTAEELLKMVKKYPEIDFTSPPKPELIIILLRDIYYYDLWSPDCKRTKETNDKMYELVRRYIVDNIEYIPIHPLTYITVLNNVDPPLIQEIMKEEE